MKYLKMSALLLSISILLLSGCSKEEAVSKPTETTKPVETTSPVEVTQAKYTQYDLDLEGRVFLGKEEAEHTIVLAFDYSCPWCKKWMLETLPEIQTKYIDTGKAKYISQPLALLNKNSLYMAEVDQVIEEKLPTEYYKLQVAFAADSEERENGTWGNKSYIQKKFKELNLDYKKTFSKSETGEKDPLTITRNYTKNYGVEYVPTVYVDGIKISDSFNVEEMGYIIEGQIQESEITKAEVK